MQRFHTLSRLKPILFLVGSMISLTSGASLAKNLFQIAGAEGITAIRVGFGALMLGALWRPWRFQFSKHQLKSILMYGISLGSMNLCFYLAIERLPIGLAIALEFLGPLSVALFYSRRWVDFIWAFLAALGVALILPIWNSSLGMIDLLGVLYALGAALAWALYIVIGKNAGVGLPQGVVTSSGMFVAFLTVAPFGLTSGVLLLLEPSHLLLGLGVGLLSSAIPYSFEMSALKQLPSRHFGLLMSLEPAIGALVAFVILGERLLASQLVAMLFIIGASIGSTLTAYKKES